MRQATLTADCNGGQRARYVALVLRAEFVPSFGWGGLISGSTANGGFILTGDAAVRVQ